MTTIGHPLATSARLLPVSTHVLQAFTRSAPTGALGAEYSIDFGPAVLASLIAGPRRPPPDAPESLAVAAWLRQLRHGCNHPGLFGWGLAGYLLGLRSAALTWPGLGGLVERARKELAATASWQAENLAWYDYDLVTGTSGTLLVLASDPACTPDDLEATATHLTALCTRDDLQGLRVGHYKDEQMRGWNHGRVNTGMAHGATGVTAALCRAAEAGGLSDELASALRRLATWLVEHSATGDRGLCSWPIAGGLSDLPLRPQAWCYGTPGISWTLWETGRVLSDPRLQAFALDAAASFLRAYDEDIHQPDLSVCHGIPGLILICDAFDRYTPLQGAGELRDRLLRGLLDRLDEVAVLAEHDCTLLSGATGACAVLLTLRSGTRSWLPAFGLR
ncbi:lanthionine synthetase LanC family protein [Streptomyces violascens]|uniref:lanthionine synthetase LanC family protein n=1 Tax=Streptomyces violascens TaxID=67381 RepID=UPI0036C7E7D5